MYSYYDSINNILKMEKTDKDGDGFKHLRSFSCPDVTFIQSKWKGFIFDESNNEFLRCKIEKGHHLYELWKKKDCKLLARHVSAKDPNEYIYILDVCDASSFAFKNEIGFLDVDISGSMMVNIHGNNVCNGWEFNKKAVKDHVINSLNYFQENFFKSLYMFDPSRFKELF